MKNRSHKKTSRAIHLQQKSHADPPIFQICSKPADVRIQRIVDLLKKNPCLRFSTLARHIHVSPSRLVHLFKQQTGQSLTSYMLAVRLARAARQLQEGGLFVKAIAADAGYAHFPSFARAFKRKFGVRPLAYRHRNAARRSR